ncbi:MAG TPA: carboxypeptidase regulatory-like domain-containing protein [Verrucomicrobiae bacterium]|jgi:peroxiredoxin|nr:carboxypeptidase regulatory-like domain-containing protein [Verrucomicrobiae bacterium]
MKPILLTLALCFFIFDSIAQTNDGRMHLRVVDAETGQPLAGVKVRAWSGSGLMTDEAGTCSFPMPETVVTRFFYRITLTKPGYVGKHITWSEAQKDKVGDIPTQYTAKLDKGVTIGAVVKNEKGDPVPGARVVFFGTTAISPDGRERTVIAPNYHAERTDDDGRWQNSEVPKDFSQMRFYVVHRDYVPATFGCEGGPDAGADSVQWPASDYLSGKAVMLLTHGIEVSGVVVDSSGKPVPETTITRDHQWRNTAAVQTTGDDGRFKISNLRRGEMVLTFQAKGLAAQTRELTLSNGMPELKIELKPGNIFQGVVVDEAGKPIPGARAQLDRLELGPLEYDWNSFTDDQGRFMWDSAPDGAHPYYFSAGGYRPRSEPQLVADGRDKIITLRRDDAGGKTVFDGCVTDAESKAPVPQFTVWVKEFKGGATAHSQKKVSATNGAYSVSVDSYSMGCMIEVSAPGYAPLMSERKSPPDGDQRLDFALAKGQGIAGTVYSPDGKPAAGAEVAVCGQGQGAFLGQGYFVDRFQTNITGADENGEFVLPEPAGALSLCAAGTHGFGETNIADGAGPIRIRLAAWGAIKGAATTDGKPLAGEKLGLLEPPERRNGFALDREDFTVKTGADGGFVFSNVPPGKTALCRIVNNKYFPRQILEVNAGSVTEAQYGGAGRALAGKFTVHGYNGGIDWTNGQTLQLSSADSAQPLSFGATIEPDGGFKVEDVPAGAYKLQIEVRQPLEQGGERIATLVTNIFVSAGNGLVDLGGIDVPLKKTLKVGDLAPAFVVKTVDGRTLRLSDFRGKYVLLDFWATWCGPCVGETPNLKATYDAFGGSDHFAVIGLSLDNAVDAPANYARKNNIKWNQGFLGQWSEDSVTALYGVDGIPSIFLIDPEGRIIERDLRGDAIRAAVERALGNR